ncbi:MAG: hypothetical protein IT292_00385 [Deltaproteobacteria bacterium]|nr:hypothetical protein [Deltaproteobacteria bacterium]
MAKQDDLNNLANNELSNRQRGVDCLAGPIRFSSDIRGETNSPVSDSFDYDLGSHIDHYLQQLPDNLKLCSLSRLSLNDPKAALAIINALRENVDRELQKARRLQSLYRATPAAY